MGWAQAWKDSGVASSAASHLDLSLHSLDCRSQELQRGQRELPSGQSLQFSPSALPLAAQPGCLRRSKPGREAAQGRRESGGRAASVGKDTRGPDFLQNYQTVEEAHRRGKNSFSPIMRSIFFFIVLLFYCQYSVVRNPMFCYLNFPNVNIR